MFEGNGTPIAKILEHANYYHIMGFSLVPMKMQTKLPNSKWKHLQEERLSMNGIANAFRHDSDLGLGVIFGEVSGGLASRDFDDMGAYEAWAKEYPYLADSLPTVATNRGRHVYCRTTPESVTAAREALGKQRGNGAIKFDDGELRCGVGCYSILPPSIHPSGHEYAWTVKPTTGEKFPKLDLLEVGFTTCFAASTKAHTRGRMSTHEDTGVHRTCLSPLVFSCVALTGDREKDDQKIRKSIDQIIPTGPGKRHLLIFELARVLKGYFLDGNPFDMRQYVEYWHSRSIAFITTKDFEDSWFDFVEAWDKVQYPKGAATMTAILERAMAREPPECAKQFGNPKLRQLVAICRELQRTTEDDSFFLSCRMAASLVDVEFPKASLWLRVLPKFKVLELVHQGQLVGRKASEYRYIGD